MVRAEQSVPILVDVGRTGGGRAVPPLVVRVPERRGGYHAVAHHEHGVRLVRVLVVTRRQPDAVPELNVEKSVARARVVAVRRAVTGVEELLVQHHAVGEGDLRRVDERNRACCHGEGGEREAAGSARVGRAREREKQPRVTCLFEFHRGGSQRGRRGGFAHLGRA